MQKNSRNKICIVEPQNRKQVEITKQLIFVYQIIKVANSDTY